MLPKMHRNSGGYSHKMPELPDVEVYRRYIENNLLNKKIVNSRVLENRILYKISAGFLTGRLNNNYFEKVRRHGKYLFLKLYKDNWVLVHFGMTGDVAFVKKGNEIPRYTRVEVEFENGDKFVFTSRRLLGKISFIDDPDKFIEKENLGPDALDIDENIFKKIFLKRKSMVKSSFLNQNVIAGIGNIYSDEILYQARISPMRVELSGEEIKNLYDVMKGILETAISSGADPNKLPKDWFLHFRKEGADCPSECGGKVKKVQFAGRGAYYCPSCQK